VRKLEALVTEQQRKIDEYENEGALSTMIKKSNGLERELVHLYQKLEAKEKSIGARLLQPTRNSG